MQGVITPGTAVTLIILAGAYTFYRLDRSVAENNDGIGLVHTWLDGIIAEGEDPDVFYAKEEETRQRMKDHYELSQSPMYRTTYPE